jgi:hypothetical protein
MLYLSAVRDATAVMNDRSGSSWWVYRLHMESDLLEIGPWLLGLLTSATTMTTVRSIVGILAYSLAARFSSTSFKLDIKPARETADLLASTS